MHKGQPPVSDVLQFELCWSLDPQQQVTPPLQHLMIGTSSEQAAYFTATVCLNALPVAFTRTADHLQITFEANCLLQQYQRCADQLQVLL